MAGKVSDILLQSSIPFFVVCLSHLVVLSCLRGLWVVYCDFYFEEIVGGVFGSGIWVVLEKVL
jgi:hypothetical protein